MCSLSTVHACKCFLLCGSLVCMSICCPILLIPLTVSVSILEQMTTTYSWGILLQGKQEEWKPKFKKMHDLNSHTTGLNQMTYLMLNINKWLGNKRVFKGNSLVHESVLWRKKSFWKQWQYICFISLLIIRAEINGQQNSTVAVGNRERANSHWSDVFTSKGCQWRKTLEGKPFIVTVNPLLTPPFSINPPFSGEES